MRDGITQPSSLFECPECGAKIDLPPDLMKLLRDPTPVQRDFEVRLADGRTLAQHLEEWRNAPSNTASAHLPPCETCGGVEWHKDGCKWNG